MKIKWNPIVKKDLQAAVRSRRLSWELFAYEAVQALAFWLVLEFVQNQSRHVNVNGGENIYSYMSRLFLFLGMVQACIVLFTVPVITAASISGEKERQTFELMLATSMSYFSIVWGKVVSAVLRVLLYVAAGIPIMAMAFVAGGLSWSYLFYFFLVIIVLSVFAGCVGVCCSAFCKNTMSAVILSFLCYFAVCIATFFPMLLRCLWGNGKMGESLLFLLFNPLLYIEEFFEHTDISFFHVSSMVFRLYESCEMGFVSRCVSYGSRNAWMPASTVCILMLSYAFLRLAAWKINPLNSKD